MRILDFEDVDIGVSESWFFHWCPPHMIIYLIWVQQSYQSGSIFESGDPGLGWPCQISAQEDLSRVVWMHPWSSLIPPSVWPKQSQIPNQSGENLSMNGLECDFACGGQKAIWLGAGHLNKVCSSIPKQLQSGHDHPDSANNLSDNFQAPAEHLIDQLCPNKLTFFDRNIPKQPQKPCTNGSTVIIHWTYCTFLFGHNAPWKKMSFLIQPLLFDNCNLSNKIFIMPALCAKYVFAFEVGSSSIHLRVRHDHWKR